MKTKNNKRTQTKNTKTAFGNAVRRMRVAAGMTQNDLARETYRTDESISAIERGKTAPNPRMLKRLYEIFPRLPKTQPGKNMPGRGRISTAFGKALSKEIQESEISLSTVSRRSGTSVQTLYSIRVGLRRVNARQHAALVKMFPALKKVNADIARATKRSR